MIESFIRRHAQLLTNRNIGKSAPSVYLADLQKSYNASEDRMDDILRTHASLVSARFEAITLMPSSRSESRHYSAESRPLCPFACDIVIVSDVDNFEDTEVEQFA
jgi:hypothetical protein